MGTGGVCFCLTVTGILPRRDKRIDNKIIDKIITKKGNKQGGYTVTGRQMVTEGWGQLGTVFLGVGGC